MRRARPQRPAAPACAAPIVAALLALAPAAHAQEPPPACPAVTAKATIVVEQSTRQVACASRADARRPIASATKLMTALLVLERLETADTVPAAAYRALPVESQIGLRTGEEMTVADLLRALLLESANDAAVTLAEAVSGSRRAFVRDMNARAEALGMERTRFVDSIGIGAGNRSTARDLVALTLELRRYRFFRRTVNRTAATLESGDRVRVVQNRNDLVRRLGWIDGVKTGHTNQAGYVLVASGRRRDVGLVSVVLGAGSETARSEDTLRILQSAFRRFRRVTPLARGTVQGSVEIAYRRGAMLPLEAGRSVRLTVLREQANAFDIRVAGVPDEVEGPVARGDAIGRIEVLQGDRVVGRVPLVAAATVPEAGTAQRIKHYFTKPLTVALVLVVLGCSLLLVRMARRRGSPPRRRRSGGEPEAA